MNLQIANKTEEPLLSRVKVTGEVSFDSVTPSTKDIQTAVGKAVGKDAKLVAVEKIDTAFGKHVASVVAYAYDSEDMIAKTIKEGKKLIEKRKKAEEEAKKAEEEKKKAEEEAKKAAEEKKE